MLTGYPGLWRAIVLVVVAASVWALASPLLLLFPVFQDGAGAAVNAFQSGRLTEALLVVLPAAVAGLVGLAGTALVAHGNGKGKVLLGAAALALLALTVFTAATIGRVFFPPGIVLALAALWLPPPSPP